MDMPTPLDVEIRDRIASVLSGDVPLRDFYLWFVPATWQVERSENSEAIRLTYDIAHVFSELSAGDVTREEITRRLELVASTGISPGRHRIA